MMVLTLDRAWFSPSFLRLDAVGWALRSVASIIQSIRTLWHRMLPTGKDQIKDTLPD